MNSKSLFWLGLVASLGLVTPAWSQLPAPSAATTGASPANLWSFLCLNAEQKANLKTCFCNSPLGQMMSGGSGPMSMMTGGMIPNRCLQNSIANNLKKPADSPDGLAARVMQDEEDAKARRAAVRFLGTVDCNYWPEAVDTLKISLRKDRNECVRFEAALALQHGCCCNKEIMEALRICVSGTKEDGFPAEHSERVRAAAADALSHCAMVQEPEVIPVPPAEKEKERQKVDADMPVDPQAYYKKISETPRQEIVAKARLALAVGPQSAKVAVGSSAPAIPGQQTASTVEVPVNQPRRPTSLAGIFSNAVSGPAPVAHAPVVANSQPATPPAPAVLQAPYVQAIPVSQSKPAPQQVQAKQQVQTPQPAPAPVEPAPTVRRERTTVFSILSQTFGSRPAPARSEPKASEGEAPSVVPLPQPIGPPPVNNVQPATMPAVLPVIPPQRP